MRPNKEQLNGTSPSQFKTMLKRCGHIVPRNFFNRGCVSVYKNRMYRFRHWSDVFVVDVSCRLPDFDRWANSTDMSVTFTEWEQSTHKLD